MPLNKTDLSALISAVDKSYELSLLAQVCILTECITFLFGNPLDLQ